VRRTDALGQSVSFREGEAPPGNQAIGKRSAQT